MRQRCSFLLLRVLKSTTIPSANSKALQMHSPYSFTDHVTAILRGINRNSVQREEMADDVAGGFFKGYFRSQLKKTKAIKKTGR